MYAAHSRSRRHAVPELINGVIPSFCGAHRGGLPRAQEELKKQQRRERFNLPPTAEEKAKMEAAARAATAKELAEKKQVSCYSLLLYMCCLVLAPITAFGRAIALRRCPLLQRWPGIQARAERFGIAKEESKPVAASKAAEDDKAAARAKRFAGNAEPKDSPAAKKAATAAADPELAAKLKARAERFGVPTK